VDDGVMGGGRREIGFEEFACVRSPVEKPVGIWNCYRWIFRCSVALSICSSVMFSEKVEIYKVRVLGSCTRERAIQICCLWQSHHIINFVMNLDSKLAILSNFKHCLKCKCCNQIALEKKNTIEDLLSRMLNSISPHYHFWHQFISV
jgi:hypothetical protein